MVLSEKHIHPYIRDLMEKVNASGDALLQRYRGRLLRSLRSLAMTQ